MPALSPRMNRVISRNVSDCLLPYQSPTKSARSATLETILGEKSASKETRWERHQRRTKNELNKKNREINRLILSLVPKNKVQMKGMNPQERIKLGKQIAKQQEDIKVKLYAENQSLIDRQIIADKVNKEKDYSSMKATLNKLVSGSTISKLVEHQEDKLQRRLKAEKLRKAQMKHQPPQNFTKIPLRKINNNCIITEEMAKKEFPNCDASNMNFYVDVMCEFLRA